MTTKAQVHFVEWTPSIFGWQYPIRPLKENPKYPYASSVLPHGYVIRYDGRNWCAFSRAGKKEAVGSLKWCCWHIELRLAKPPKTANPDGEDVLQKLRLLAIREGWQLSRWSLDRLVVP